MGLFAPWFLAGVAAVGLPIYLHLLRRHATTPRPFSSLMFFEPRTESSIRHRRLRYLLLLSLRLALLVLLVIDSSFSMGAGSRLNDAKREALSVLGSRRLSEHVQIMALDSQLHVLTEPTQDRATERAGLDDIHAGDSRR